MTEEQFKSLEDRLLGELGAPVCWPKPLPTPKFWELSRWAQEIEFRKFFGNVTKDSRLKYWEEARRPELVGQDVDNLIVRSYRAMLGLPN